MGRFPKSVRIFSMNAASRSKFTVAVPSGVFSSALRAAVSEKHHSSNVKCSEIFMSDFRALDFRVPDFRELVKSKVDSEHIAALILRPYILPDRSRGTTRGVWKRQMRCRRSYCRERSLSGLLKC